MKYSDVKRGFIIKEVKMEEKLLKIKQIKIDESIYPRNKWGWQTSYDYAESMKTGAQFPAILVGLANSQYYLIDGRHRLEALKMNKKDHVQAEILRGLSKKEMFVEAIKRNIQHGRQLSMQDKIKVAARLKDLNFTPAKISELVQIPSGKLKQFIAERVTNTLNGDRVILKAPVKNMGDKSVSDDFDNIQDSISSHSQGSILDQVITILENELLDFKNKAVKRKLNRLAYLVNELQIKYDFVKPRGKKKWSGKRKSRGQKKKSKK